MENTSFFPSGPPLCALVSTIKRFGVFYEIRSGNSLQKLAKESECRERLSGNQILHKDVPEFLHIPPVFPENLVNSIH